MEEISQEKAQEYREVAGLLVQDIEVLNDIILEYKNLTAEQLVGQIIRLHKNTQNLINNPEIRKKRFNASCVLYDL